MTLDEFETRIDEFGQELLNLTPILTEIGNEMTAELRSAASSEFSNSSGALASSISVSVSVDSFAVSMNDYGAYQNYGVAGVANETTQATVEEGISLQPREGSTYSFQYGVISRNSGLPFAVRKSIGQKGLRKRPFFSVADLQQEVVDKLQQRINQAFE